MATKTNISLLISALPFLLLFSLRTEVAARSPILDFSRRGDLCRAPKNGMDRFSN